MVRGSIPIETVRRIQESIDIVDVVSHYLTLRKSGQNYVGLCPFHHEKTPSFVVSQTKQLFHCFGCGAGGDVFGFLMKADSLNFPEAVRDLGERTGISIPLSSSPPENPTESTLIESLLKIHQEAVNYYHRLLLDHSEAELARHYLEGRGIHRETVQAFMLGYALPQWDGLLKYLKRQGGSPDQIERAGLAVLREDSTGHYDRFRDRLIFPIRNLQGKVIAFGGRILPAHQSAPSAPGGGLTGGNTPLPKYLNSPETPLYIKGQHLYALDKARGAASQAGTLVIVEGYLDALAAHQAGIQNVAATLGTALTPEHLHLIRRFARRVILVFDPDLAGVRAALRTVELFLNSGVNAQVVTLPEGEDPDSFIRKQGPEAFKELLSKPSGLLEFALHQMVAKVSKKTLEEKLGIIEEVLPVLGKISNHVERSHYLKWVADQLQVREGDLGQELTHHLRQSKKVHKQEAPPTLKGRQFPIEEEMIIKLLLQGQVKADTLRGRVHEQDFTDPRLGHLFTLAMDNCQEGGELQIRELLNATQHGDEINLLVSAWSLQELACDDYEKTVEDCLQSLHAKRLGRELREMEERIRRAEQEADREAVQLLQQGVLSLKRQMLLTQQGH